jgi:hypothetical protein
MNNESMRIDTCLSLTFFFFPRLIESKNFVTIKKLSMQLVLEPSMW